MLSSERVPEVQEASLRKWTCINTNEAIITMASHRIAVAEEITRSRRSNKPIHRLGLLHSYIVSSMKSQTQPSESEDSRSTNITVVEVGDISFSIEISNSQAKVLGGAAALVTVATPVVVYVF